MIASSLSFPAGSKESSGFKNNVDLLKINTTDGDLVQSASYQIWLLVIDQFEVGCAQLDCMQTGLRPLAKPGQAEQHYAGLALFSPSN